MIAALALAAAVGALPFPLEPGSVWVYREAYAERRGEVDAITEEETSFAARVHGRRLLVEQKGGADPAGVTPVEIGRDFLRIGAFTGEEALPLPLEVGRSGPHEENQPGFTVEAEEDVSVPAGSYKALRCALRTWRWESVLWIAPGVGVVRQTEGPPGRRPEIERVLLRVIFSTARP